MSRNKSSLVVLTLAAIIGLGYQLQAQTVQVMIAGSSAQWQTQALGAFGGLEAGSTVKGHCGKYIGAKAPCYHYTASSGFSLYDTRPSTANVDGEPSGSCGIARLLQKYGHSSRWIPALASAATLPILPVTSRPLPFLPQATSSPALCGEVTRPCQPPSGACLPVRRISQ